MTTHPANAAHCATDSNTEMPLASLAHEIQLPTSPEPCLPYRILIYHTGQSFVAEVLELPGCKAQGDSYEHALEGAKQAISDYVSRALSSGQLPPQLFTRQEMLKAIRTCVTTQVFQPLNRRKFTPIRARLAAIHGNLSNRELAARIGVYGNDASSALSSASTGKGTRKIRCAIALCLETPPSQLWPHRSSAMRDEDDAMYFWLKTNPRATNPID